MINDKQRREVAARLRTLADGESPMAERSVDALYTALGLPCSGTGIECAAIGYLADLIDRPRYRPFIPNAMEGYVFCPQCGAEIGEYGVPNYCHNCGVAIHNGC